MQMTEKEIIRSYKEAKRKQEQIKILADLNTCQKEDIRKILREAGLDVPATGNRYTKKKEEPEASGSKRKRLLKNEEPAERSNLSAPEDPGKTMFGDSLEAKKTEEKAETNCSECQGMDGCGSAKPDGIYCSGFKPKKKETAPVPPEVIDAAESWLRSYEKEIEVLEKELEDVREKAERIRAWLAIQQGKVTCSSCRHLAQEEMQGQAAPVSICRAEIWKQLGKAPHVIGHDTEKPIFCNHWEGGEEI